MYASYFPDFATIIVSMPQASNHTAKLANENLEMATDLMTSALEPGETMVVAWKDTVLAAVKGRV